MDLTANTHLYMHLCPFGNKKEKRSDAEKLVFYWIDSENSRRALYIALSKPMAMHRFDEAKVIDIARKPFATTSSESTIRIDK